MPIRPEIPLISKERCQKVRWVPVDQTRHTFWVGTKNSKYLTKHLLSNDSSSPLFTLQLINIQFTYSVAICRLSWGNFFLIQKVSIQFLIFSLLALQLLIATSKGLSLYKELNIGILSFRIFWASKELATLISPWMLVIQHSDFGDPVLLISPSSLHSLRQWLFSILTSLKWKILVYAFLALLTL